MIKKYPLENIHKSPSQARQIEDPEYILDLACSIKANGMIQTPRGRLDPEFVEPFVQLACGHERLAAYGLLAEKDTRIFTPEELAAAPDPWPWAEMPVDVEELTDRQMFEIGITENLKRKPLTPIEIGDAMRFYVEHFGATWTEAGRLFGYTQSATSNLVRLGKLQEPIKAMVEDHRLAERQARQLLAVEKLSEPKALAIAEKVAAAPVQDRDELLQDELNHVLHGKDCRELDDRVNGFPLEWSDMSAEIPTCVECPMRIGDDTCARPDCFDRKSAAWKLLRLKAVAAETGIPELQPGEAAKSIPEDWENRNLVDKAIKQKLPFLRWMVVKINDPAHFDYNEKTGHPLIALGTVDLKAWAETLEAGQKAHAKSTRAAEKAEASDDPKARAKHEKEIQAMRKEKGEKIRNRYDIDWIVRHTVDEIAPRLSIGGAAVRHFAERVDEKWWSDRSGGGEDIQTLMDEIQDLRKKAGSQSIQEGQARRQFSLYLFCDVPGWRSDERKEIEEAFTGLAEAIAVKLPKGWNEPPIHRTEHNCWHCGRFASQEGKILQAEIDDGWGRVWQGEKWLDVNCPACQDKPCKVEPVQPVKAKPAAKKPSKPKTKSKRK